MKKNIKNHTQPETGQCFSVGKGPTEDGSFYTHHYCEYGVFLKGVTLIPSDNNEWRLQGAEIGDLLTAKYVPQQVRSRFDKYNKYYNKYDWDTATFQDQLTDRRLRVRLNDFGKIEYSAMSFVHFQIEDEMVTALNNLDLKKIDQSKDSSSDL